MPKYLIIGCGPAALAAVEKIRSLDEHGEIKVVSGENEQPYCRTVLPYLLAGKVAESSIWTADSQYFDKLRTVFAPGREVVRIVPEKKSVLYRQGDPDIYDKLLIACGAQPVAPSLKGLDAKNLLTFHTLSDYCQLSGSLGTAAATVILGGGLIGLQLAAGLSGKGHKVALVEKEKQILSTYFNQPVAGRLVDILRQHNVEVFTGEDVIESRQRDGLTEIRCASGKTMRANSVVSCVGVRPNISFLTDSGISINRGVVVDAGMRTNVSDVYAAGDVAEAADFFTGLPGTSAIIPSAVAQGKIAGTNMAGGQASYEGSIPMNRLNLFGHQASSIGLALLKDGHAEVMEQEVKNTGAFSRLVFRDDTLVGALFLDVDVLPGIIRYLIQNKVKIGRHKQSLLSRTKETACALMVQAERTPGNG